jgi:flagellar basal-body rod protein FlgB
MPNLIRNDYAFGAITKALDGLSLRSKAITNNVANIDTPGFKSAEVTFEQELQAAVLRPVADDFQIHQRRVVCNRPTSRGRGQMISQLGSKIVSREALTVT